MKLFNNIVISSRSERERERERESNLNFASSLFKKSFTLIELSIVLLILSLLVGSLLVGRQIVDRAKIQRIIFEFDYYEKAFHQFYDTYRIIPGHMTQKVCKRYAVFSQNTVDDGTPKNMCAKIIDRNIGSKKVLQSYWTQVSAMPMTWVICAGFVEKRFPLSYVKCGGGFPGGGYHLDEYVNDNSLLVNHSNDHVGGVIMAARANKSTFDNSVLVQYVGFDPQFYQYSYLLYQTAGYPANNENTNKVWLQSVFNHNTIAIFGNGGSSVASERGASRGLNAAFSSKIASDIDAKIDDGRPATGKVVASKGNHFVKVNSDDEKKAICYDKTFDEVDKAIYNESKDVKYGCNLLKVMEDVK